MCLMVSLEINNMTEKDIEIWDECVSEMSLEGQQETDVFLRDVLRDLTVQDIAVCVILSYQNQQAPGQ